MSLLNHYGMDEEERRRRQSFLEITAQDADNIRSLRGVFAEHARAFAEGFYQHLLSHPHTAALLRDPNQLERLKKLQADYFAGLLEGAFDAAYFDARLRVGRAHQRVGVAPAWYLGAYNQYIQLTFPFFARSLPGEIEEILPRLLSLVKVIFLDIGLALDTYFQDALEQVGRRNQELQHGLGLYQQSHRREEQLRKLASHEIRGGLAGVITTLEDLADVAGTDLKPAAADQLASAIRRCWSLSNLLKEMLSAPETTEPTWVDTRPLFASLVERFGLYAEGRAIQLHLPDRPPCVWADPLQLREVFANLISNSVRFMDTEGGFIQLSSYPEGGFHVFCVADNGPGVPEHLRERIFEPFVAGPPAGGKPEGTGLGLYFVRAAVEQGGGRIWFESSPGQGCRFSFTVPGVPPSVRSDLPRSLDSEPGSNAP